MASELYFNVVNGPGPYRLLQAYMLMYEKHAKPIIELGLQPIDVGAEFLGHTQKMYASFEIALLGPAIASEVGDKGIRLLGRFIQYPNPGFKSWGIIKELFQWQWEVILESDRIGYVRKLDATLQEEWTKD